MKNKTLKSEETTKQVVTLLNKAFENGMSLFLEEGQLKIKAAKGKQLDADLIAMLKANKEAITDFLKSKAQQAHEVGDEKIIAVNRDEVDRLPLSFAQQRLWFVDEMSGSTHYHIPTVLRLKGQLNREHLEEAFRGVVNRHEVLRTVFDEEDGTPFQQVLEGGQWNLDYEDISKEIASIGMDEHIAKLVSQPFDLSKDHMLRAHLLKLSEEEYLVVLVMHHIASDGWSTPIFVKELVELYQANQEGRPAQLPPLSLQYADYAHWQRNYLQGAVLDEKLGYWKKQLQDITPLELPTDYPRPTIQSTNGASQIYTIDKTLSQQLQALARKEGVTFYMLLLGAFKVLLYRYTRQEDICVGSPIANRMQPEVESLIGFFVNTLCLRSNLEGNPRFTDLLAELKATALDAYTHQDVPFEKIVERVVTNRDLSRTALFQVLFVLQNNAESPAIQLNQLSLQSEPVSTEAAKFDLTFRLTESEEGISVNIQYCSDLFTPVTIERMMGHYQFLLSAILADPHQCIDELKMLLPQEEQQLLHDFNDTAFPNPKDKTLIDLFEEHVEQTPNQLALQFQEQSLTYRQLDEQANRLAHQLQASGITKEDKVALCLDRSIEMIVAILGVLKSDAAYVPIDPDYPKRRIDFMLEDSTAKLLLLTTRQQALFEGEVKVKLLFVDQLADGPITAPERTITPQNLAYVIYTSGSTGVPKGVQVEHASIVNEVSYYANAFGFDATDKQLILANYVFDASVEQIFLPLSSGATLLVVSKDCLLDAEALEKEIDEKGVTHFQGTPSLVQTIRPKAYSKLKRVCSGGESCPLTLASSWSPYVRFFNKYGPTETTVNSSYHPFDPAANYSGTLPIGQPVGNTQLYILDKQEQLVPIGLVGELYIGGKGVSRGYLNRGELNAEKFIPSPFKKGERLYRTGDLARWIIEYSNGQQKGIVEYKGRMDVQVKVRGHRIELGEIENVVQEYVPIVQCSVLAKEAADGEKRLVAYIVAEEGFVKEQLVDYLKEQLPYYMIPGLIVELEEIPLTANGKVDKKALPEPDVSELISNEFVAPRNFVERQIANIWKELLHLERVGVYDNFFELGGHSLLATRVVSAIRKELQIELAIRELFAKPTIADLAAFATTQDQATLMPDIVVQERPERIPLSYSQERLWFIENLSGSVHYLVPAVLGLHGQLDKEVLEKAFNEIVNRHEVLRTVFMEENGTAWQKVLEKDRWKMEFVDLSKEEEQKALEVYIEAEASRPFDLTTDYMLRVQLIKIKEEEHALLVILHHIASDGWSMPIFVKEMVELYRAIKQERSADLPSLEVQFADYALWQRNYLGDGILDAQMKYWEEKLHDVAVLQLPTDFPRPSVPSTRGHSMYFDFDIKLSEQIEAFCKKESVTTFMMLLSVFKVLLHRYSGQEDICVGSPIANRTQTATEPLIGFFVNTLALRSDLSGNPTFLELLARIKAMTLEAYSHQEVPFEKIVDKVAQEREVSRNPLFQVAFVLQNTPDVPDIIFDNLRISTKTVDSETTKFDLTFCMVETGQGLQLVIQYCRDLFTPTTIQQMEQHFAQLLQAVLTNPTQSIAQLEMLSATEQQQLLNNFSNKPVAYPKDKTIVDLLEEQWQKTPNHTALIFEEQQLTYDQLHQQANQLAHYLQKQGVEQESLVAVCLDRSIEMVVALLAILKAGGAYVPIDPDYPQERIQYILDDAEINYVVSREAHSSLLKGSELVATIKVDEDLTAIQKQPTIHLQTTLTPDNLAYVIYTSGSTGQPKGALIEHRNVVRLFEHEAPLFDFGEKDIWTLFHSYCFDFSVWEMYGALFYGGTLVVVADEVRKDPSAFGRLLQDKGVTVLNQTPGYFYQLQDALSSNFPSLAVRYLIFGGEALSPSRLRDWYTAYPDCQLINMYGITETTVHVTYKVIGEQEIDAGVSNIGKAIPTLNCLILDPSGQLSPIGVAGELYVSGAGLARGYLNRPELTAQRFIPHPFSSEDKRLYKTGDLARWLPDGNIEYFGRIDHQVKVRGYRIELGEIESVINQQEAIVSNCVVVKKAVDDSNYLVAYYMPDEQLLKQDEQRLYQRHLENWENIYNEEYEDTTTVTDEEFNITGWMDSFTGQQIPAEHMLEWQKDIIGTIRSTKPRRVLEIGCGTGLIYFQLAGHVDKYTGFDLSTTCVNQIRSRIAKGERKYPETALAVSAADQITLDEKEEIDTIVINSVIQYFPGENYLFDIITNCIGYLNGSGKIIIGDVCNNGLQRGFKSRISLSNLPERISIEDFSWIVDKEILADKELCVSPEFFYDLKRHFPQITHVDIALKQGEHINEMSLYRYNVVVYVGIEKPISTPKWQVWDKTDKDKLQQALQSGQAQIALSDVPNPRLWREALLEQGLQEARFSTLDSLSKFIQNCPEEINTLRSLQTLAAEQGYQSRMLVSKDPLKMHLLLERAPSDTFVSTPFTKQRTWDTSIASNFPLFYEATLNLQKTMKQALLNTLPEYMSPTKFIALKRIPLTSNGKVDRKFLQKDKDRNQNEYFNYVAPTTSIEQQLVEIWSELLQIDKIGIHDNFFELGGHSLLATRVVSAIRKELDLEIAIKNIFTYPSIFQLAKCIEAEGIQATIPMITAQQRPERIPLSFSQERLWFIDSMDGSLHYHMPSISRFKGDLDQDALAYALNEIVNRHEVLRTIYKGAAGEAWQEVLPQDEWELVHIDCSQLSEEALSKHIGSFIRKPFNLSKDHSIRAQLMTLGEQTYILVLVMHHIASDGWSIPIFVKEMSRLYLAAKNKRAVNLPALLIQYADYAIWQRRYLQGDIIDSQMGYWEKTLAGLEPLDMPTDFPRPRIQSNSGATLYVNINKTLCDGMKELTRKEGATLFMGLLAALKVLLYRYSGQEDICVGSPIANRTQSAVEPLIGFFINSLALRSDLSGQPSFKTLLTQIRDTTLQAYAHQDIPFEKVVDKVAVGRDLSRSPLFQVFFALQNNADIPVLELEGLTFLEKTSESYSSAMFDLAFNATETSEGLDLAVIYCRDLFSEETIARMVQHYQSLLTEILRQPTQSIGKLPYLSQSEEYHLLHELSGTSKTYDTTNSIVDLFAEQATLYPQKIAVANDQNHLSYQELDRQSNQLAHHLQQKGVKGNSIVALCMDRSTELITSLLAILKAGAAYLPIDPIYPLSRVQHVLQDAEPAMVISNKKLAHLFEGEEHRLLLLDEEQSEIQKQLRHRPTVNVGMEDLVYIIYTSGSTGRPKGVEIPHRSICNFVHWHNDFYEVSAASRATVMAGISFDALGWEIWPYLTSGGGLYIPNEEERLSTKALFDFYVKNKITHSFLATALAPEFVETSRNRAIPLQFLFTGGDALPIVDVTGIDYRFFNNYGPTENTILTTCYELTTEDKHRRASIGRPLTNVKVYVLDQDNQLVPVGVPGELHVGGANLAKGYLNRPELSKEKFALINIDGKQPMRLYKTGDMARWDTDGNLEFLGRRDHQIQLRGFRIELGEIENVVLQSPQIKQCTLIAAKDANNNLRLIAYVVPEKDFDKERLQSHLKSQLPEYMVPAVFVEMSSLPLTPNGKIDRKGLPSPDTAALISSNYVAPRNEVEIQLAKIWKRLLKVEQVGVYDNFFELGGHSLLAARVVAAVRKHIVLEISIRDLFAAPTIAELATFLTAYGQVAVMPPVLPQERPAKIPLSFSQERFWFIDKLEGGTHYNMPTVLRLDGVLDRNALERAFVGIVNRHEVLRTVFRDEDGQSLQIVLPKDQWQLDFSEATEEEVPTLISSEVRKPFNLRQDHPLRVRLIKVSEEEHRLVLIIHHIASDGWSTSILVREFIELYKAAQTNRPPQLPELPIQYIDFTLWQSSWLTPDVLEDKLAYWEDKLKDLPTLNLPTDYPRPAIQSKKGETLVFKIDKALSDQLQALAKREGVTMYMLLLSAYKILLYRYSGQEDLCVGSPFANRTQKEVEVLIGIFLNTLALRSNLGNNPSFSEFLRQIKATTLEAYNHQDVPFEKIVDRVVTDRDMSRPPLCQVLFVLQNNPEIPQLELENLSISMEDSGHATSKVDIILNITERPYGMDGSFEYCSDLFLRSTMERMIDHFKLLLEAIVAEPGQRVNSLSMLSPKEVQQLMYDFNATECSYPAEKTLVQLFEEQVALTPNHPALRFEGVEWSYKELNAIANQLAAFLKKEHAVQAEDLAAICLERSEWMIIAIFGILKTGAAYMPIDPEYPEERISYMLQDSESKVLIDESFLEQFREVQAQFSTSNPPSAATATNLAYVIYTSGSSGQPKGVLTEHRSVINELNYQRSNFDLQAQDRILQAANYVFDASIEQIFLPLLFGSTLVLIPRKTLLDNESLDQVLREEHITHLHSTPSLLKTLRPKAYPALKRVLAGGEICTLELAQAWSPYATFFNKYGPTETTINSTIYKYEPEEAYSHLISLPIGKPLGNTKIYILDPSQNLVPIGVVGEVYIGGVGVSRGYLKQEELTRKKFVSSPFNIDERLYRTGDLACWLPNGLLEFKGRADNQVKIRGYRIELGEIEKVMQESPIVRQCVVVANADASGNYQLVAYIVAEGTYDKYIIQDFVKARLPEYMTPPLMIELSELPLTPNGKVDKKALPSVDVSGILEDQFIAPRNNTEEQLANIWKELLHVDQVGIHDNFFELGGHSLLATRVLSAIRKSLGVELSIRNLFELPTVSQLGALIQEQKGEDLMPAITLHERPEKVPLSFSQLRLWFIDQLEGSLHYHIPYIMEMKGQLNRELLEKAFATIVNRHEILRTVYIKHGGNPYQELLPEDSWELTYWEEGAFETEELLEAWLKIEIGRGFDLTEDHMLRVHLIKRGAEDYMLVLVFHHIASDGWSTGVLVNEFITLYRAFVTDSSPILPELPLQYADYALWQIEQMNSGRLMEQLDWWEQELQNVEPLKMATDFPRPNVLRKRGDFVGFELDKELSDELKKLTNAAGSTLFMGLLAILKVLIYRYTGQREICIGTPIANRQDKDLESLIGFFVNTLALRSDLSDNPSFIDFLEQVKKNALAAFSNQDISFEQVVDRVVKDRSLNRSPLFQVFMILQNTPEIPTLDLAGLQLSSKTHEMMNSKFDLTFSMAETPEGIKGRVEYNIELFKRSTIERMATHLKLLIKGILANPQQSIGSFHMLTAKEEHQLLYDFNDTATPYPKEKTIINLFDEQVAKTPDAIALAFEEEQLTYREVNERSNQLAHYLINQGIKENPLVPVCMGRTLELILSIVAIVKAGGAYVPIDPKYPQDRIDYMIYDSDSRLVLNPEKLIEIKAEVDSMPTHNPKPDIKPSDPAYVIYTSGTTGVPKGVMVSHQNVVSLVKETDYIQLSESDILITTCSPSFDVATFEYWGMLLNGGKAVVCSEQNLLEIDSIKSMIKEEQCTVMWFTTGWFNQLVDTDVEVFGGLKVVMAGGEQLSAYHIRTLRERYPDVTIINGYGPTENTTFSTTFSFGAEIDETISIGSPLSNRQVYILDQELQLCPVGVVGDLWVGGAGVAMGYLNHPEMTADRFRSDPFRPNSRIYRTGDLARWQNDGNIEFLGRMDDQVKVRGYRIELGEIENVLNESELLQRSVVLVRADKEQVNRIEAYVVPEGDFDKEALKDYLLTRLPIYMMPSIWVPLESLPLTANGKVNKRALVPPANVELAEREFVAPRTAEERKMVAIWQEILTLEQVSIHDNFFELGGNSIKIITLLHHLKEIYPDQLKVSDLFDYPSIAMLSTHFLKQKKGVPADKKKLRKLSL